MNTYNEFAQIYDELMDDFDYKIWFEYIEKIFIKYDKSPKKILEMACGTGNISEHFGQKGYKLTAFDISDDMLAKAYTKLNRYKNIKILKQNMIDFKLKDKYESIVSLCDSINYILKEEELLKVFKNVYNHLEKDGIFIFDINSYYKLKNIIGNNIFVEDREDIYYVWQNEYEEEYDISNFYLTFFCSEDGQAFRRFDETHRERAYKAENVKKILLNSGFKIVDIYEGFTFEAPKAKSERINFIAIK